MGRLPASLGTVALIALCPAAVARAQTSDERVAFEWRAPEGCPAGDEVRTWVERLLGSSLDTFGSQVRSVRGEITSAPGRKLRLHIVTSGTRGTRHRRIDSREDCHLLSATAVVIIALSVDESLPERLAAKDAAALGIAGAPPGGAGVAPSEITSRSDLGRATAEDTSATESAPAPPSEPATPVPAWTPPPPGLVTPEPPEESRPWNPDVSYAAALTAGIAVGQTPGAGAGVGLAGAVAVDWVRIELGGSVWPATSQPVEGGGEVGVWLWSAHLAVGPTGALSPHLAARLLAGAELGRLRADPTGLRNPAGVSDPWGALRLAPGLVYTPGGMASFGLVLHAVVPFERPRYRVPPQGVVFRPDPLVVRLNLTVELAFP